MASDHAQELMNLNRLNMRGVEIALDDFGQKYSTIERLQNLPLTYLKLDKSYFIDNKDNINQLALINSSISVAKDLNIKTIAEGVENNTVMSLVTEMGCDFAQGFYIGYPMSAKKIFNWQREWNALT
jgi:EAL domain-containing protein (putative c-di-GMP-specific phosphodiesterase class I)